MINYLLRLSYVGTDFHGWQVQPGLRTVQGVLSEALNTILGHPVKLIGCCRTDAGVHAKDYVANFLSQKDVKDEALLKALNGMLPKDIGVKEVLKVDPTFNARYHVKEKVYSYRIHNSYRRDPFLYPFVWQLPRTLDLDAMKEACNILVGEHDFSGFAKLEEEDKNTVVHLKEVNMKVEGELITISFRASHFLRYMVRRMVGAIVHVGLGKIDLKNVEEYLKGAKCPYSAKAKGLTLEEVIL
ncbi:tRNA pseudouridine(38-40) synthase TruA [Thermocrinis minervae]|uniref:tRNA pseudouridine synthase A n=1 Tax=Thermocrinis minervae TaxID=381751 RepID=A0A1M6TFQ2_9AQUI|nr:tRNA pseudouridine(38-40) synthase TruA [Thermocrinis minervae]SHK55810.1 tRNA pseudouridine38-40 synthase [Thermocrinis minervae]